MFIDVYDFYNKMERNDIMLSFKGDVTSELLTSILQIMETKLDNMQETPKIRRRVYNVLVECLQNLYHHKDEVKSEKLNETDKRSSIFMIGKNEEAYSVMTGNFIKTERIESLKGRLDRINSLSKEELRQLYQEILNNEEYSPKGGGGLGIVDIARRSGQKLRYDFLKLDSEYSFFSLYIKIPQ